MDAEQNSLHRINAMAELMESAAVRALMARVEILEAAIKTLLRTHPVPDMARDEVRDAAEAFLSDLDDAPDAIAGAAAAMQCNALCEAIAC